MILCQLLKKLLDVVSSVLFSVCLGLVQQEITFVASSAAPGKRHIRRICQDDVGYVAREVFWDHQRDGLGV